MAVYIDGEVIVESGDVLSGLIARVGGVYNPIYDTSGGTVVNAEVFDEGMLEVDSVAIGTFSNYGGVVSGTEAVAGAARGAPRSQQCDRIAGHVLTAAREACRKR
jgi:hypothetical protein